MLTRVEPKPLLVLVVSKGELMVPDTSCSCYDNYTISTERLQVKADVSKCQVFLGSFLYQLICSSNNCPCLCHFPQVSHGTGYWSI